MDPRLTPWKSPKKYFRTEYIEFLKDKNRLSLFDFEGEALDAILQSERLKLTYEKQKLFAEHKAEKLRGHVKRRKGWFKSIPRKLAHFKRAEADDMYLISYLLDNLQEYNPAGENVTYSGMNV